MGFADWIKEGAESISLLNILDPEKSIPFIKVN
jgi:hypothetical protein